MTWLPISERPGFDAQPEFQFIVVEGISEFIDPITGKNHTVRKVKIGTATIAHGGPFGYRQTDFMRICLDGDMDYSTAAVTHWCKAEWPKVEVT